MTTKMNNQGLLYVLCFVAFWAMTVPVMASNQIVQPEHLQLPLSTDDARHLLMRTGIGARAEDIVELRGQSRQVAIDNIVKGLSTKPDVPMPDWVTSPLPLYHARADMEADAKTSFNKQRDAELAQLREWWILNILQTTSPQTERMVLFWHDLFATDYRSLGKQSLAMARQNQTFRTLGFGSWEQLIKAMIRDAALLRFLDAGSNHKASPNENLARELMELFVLGEGNFDEETVREAARSLTGYASSQSHDLQFQLKTGAQDRADKQLFGHTGAFDGDDLVEILLLQDAAPKFLVTRFWHAFVSDLAPGSQWVEDQALRFRASGLNIKTLYRHVLQSEAFWHNDNRGAIVKSPVDIIAGTARTLDYPISQLLRMPQWQRLIGMDLFAPPNVAGWKEGVAFVTPGHLLNRYKVVRQMLHRAAKEQGHGQSIATSETSLDRQEMSIASDDTSKRLLDDQANAMMQSDNGMQAESSLLSLAEDVQSKANYQNLQGSELDELRTTFKAETVHMLRGVANKKNGGLMLELVLNHLQTPDKYFQHIRFIIEKKRNKAITLQLDSFSCWPDCVDPWPECSYVNKHFSASKKIILPWLSIGSEQWSSTHDHRCQFESLNENEKALVSTIWAELPNLLTLVKSTPRVQDNVDRWLPVIEALAEQYSENQRLVKISDTVYAPFAQSIDIVPEHAQPAPALQSLSAPHTQVKNIKSLITALSSEDLLLYELLLPHLSDDFVPRLPVNDPKRPNNYLKNVVEHPLFQLK